MAQIHIGRGTENLGAFTEEEVREGLRSGQFFPTDIGWTDGMENWVPLSEFPSLAGQAATPDIAPGLISPPPGSPLQEGEPVPRQGLPWDDRESLGFCNAFLETMKLILMEPAKAFSMMKREGGLGGPLLFAITSGWIGGTAALVYNFFWQMIFHSALHTTSTHPEFAAIFAGGTVVGLVLMAIFLPVLLTIGIFIVSGITHLCLMLVGGAKQPYETTFRVACFSVGATSLLQLIPIVGGWAYSIWNIIAQCFGLAKAHEISTGKAVTAVLLPFIVCCCGAFTIALTFGSFFAHHYH